MHTFYALLDSLVYIPIGVGLLMVILMVKALFTKSRRMNSES